MKSATKVTVAKCYLGKVYIFTFANGPVSAAYLEPYQTSIMKLFCKNI